MTRYQETLTLLNKIEAKYKSILNCPENDPDYLKIRALYPSTGHGKYVEQFESQIYRMAHEGYSITEIVKMVNANNYDIYDAVRKSRIKFKTVFKYKIISPTREIYYVNTLNHFVKSMFKYVPSRDNWFYFLKSRHYKVEQGTYHWKFIRNGSYYLPPYLDKPAVKNGINSYIYEEGC